VVRMGAFYAAGYKIPSMMIKKPLLATAAAALLLSWSAAARAQAADPRIAEAIRPLPDDLKADATVVAYDKATGARTVLRQGKNDIECQPKADDGFVRCYNRVLAPRRDMEAKLKAEKKSDKDVTDAIAAATKAGTNQVGAVRLDVVPLHRRSVADQTAVGDVGAQRDAGIDRRIDREPARRGAQGARHAVDDVARDARGAHHDSDQRDAAQQRHRHQAVSASFCVPRTPARSWIRRRVSLVRRARES